MNAGTIFMYLIDCLLGLLILWVFYRIVKAIYRHYEFKRIKKEVPGLLQNAMKEIIKKLKDDPDYPNFMDDYKSDDDSGDDDGD